MKAAKRILARIQKRGTAWAIVATVLLPGAGRTWATNYFWDINGTTAGAGGATPSGAWNGANTYWNSDSAGGAGTLIASPAITDYLVLSAGTDATGSYTLTASGSQNAGTGMQLDDGNPTLTGGTITFAATADLFAYNGHTLTINSTLGGLGTLLRLGNSANYWGTVVLGGNNAYAGNTSIVRGTLKLGSNTALGSGSVSIPAGAGGGAIDLNGKTIGNAVTTGLSASGPSNSGCLANSDTVNTAVINGNITLGGNNYVGGAGSVTINGLISGGVTTYAIYQQGTGTWTLSNTANTFNGFWYIVGGGTTCVTKMDNLNQPSSLGQPTVASADNVTYTGSGGTLKYIGSSASTSDRTFTLNAAAAIDASGTSGTATLTLTGAASATAAGARTFTLTGTNAGVNTFQGLISNGSGTIALAKSGSTTWALSGANTYTGGTTINTGTLGISGSNDRLPTSGTVTLAGGTLSLGALNQTIAGLTVNAGGGSITGSGTLTITGTSVTANDSATIGAPVSVTTSDPNWTVASGKTLAINTDFTFTGRTVYFQGLGATTLNGTTYSGASIRANANGTATINSGSLTTTSFVLAGSTTAGTINWNSTGTLTPGSTLYVGFSGGQGTFSQTAGTVNNGTVNGLEFNNNSTYNLNGGTLSLAARGIDYFYSGNPDTVCTLNFGGGTLRATATWSYAAGANLVYGIGSGKTAYIDTPGSSIVLNGVISGASATGLTKSGTGTLTLGGNNTYAGTTTVSAGTLKMGHANALGGSSVAINGGSLDLNGLAVGAVPASMVTPSGTTPTIINSSASAASYSGNITLTGNTYTGGGSGNFTLSGNITDSNDGYYLALYGTTITLALSGSNNFGRLAAWGGTVQLGSDNALASRTTVDLAYGGKLDVNGRTVTIARLSTSNANAGNEVKLGTGGVLTFGDASSVTYSEVISGGGSIVKQGSGTATLSGTHSYSGTTTIGAGTLLLSGTGTINSSSGIILNGASAKFLQTSSAASTPAITLTQGAVDGVGTVGNITVANLAANTVAAGNGATAALLTTGNLTFNGSGTLSLPHGSTLAVSTLALADPGGNITVNAGPEVAWALGNNRLFGYASYDGLNLGNLKVGTISGLGSRLSATGFYNNTASNEIDLVVSGDTPVWTGLVSGNWTTNAIGGAMNWKLVLGGTPTEYIDADSVLFDDSVGGGVTNITIADASVTPALVIFNNSASDYTLGGNPIAGAAALVKTGTGALTLGNVNTYTGGTEINAGTLRISGGDNRLPSGRALTLAGGTLDLGANNQTLSGVTVNAGGGAVAGSGTLTINSTSGVTANDSASIGAPVSVSTADQNWTVASGKTLSVNSNFTFTSRTVYFQGAGATVFNGTTYAGASFRANANGTATINSGDLTADSHVLAGNGTAGAIHWNSAGTLNAGGRLYVGFSGGTGTLTQTAGLVIDGSLGFEFNCNNSAYNLNGGTLRTIGLNLWEQAAGGRGTYTGCVINFGGGTLQAAATSVDGNANSGGPVAGYAIGAGKTAYLDTQGYTLTLNGVISGASAAGLTKSGSGTLALGGASTYAGTTTVSAGTLMTSGTGAINSCGSVVVDGPGAKFLHASSTASTPPITLTRGTVDGTGTVGNVTVADLAGNTVAAGNGATNAVLTTGNLTFNGSGALNLPNGSSLAVNALTFSSPSGVVTVNASRSAWTNGNNRLFGYASFDGANLADLQAGVISGLNSRQVAAGFYNDAVNHEIDLVVAGDSVAWTGLVNGNWTTNAIGGDMNWKLASGGTATEYMDTDPVLFDDTVGGGSTAITVVDPAVSPTLVTFNNSARNYTVAGNPIAGATPLTKSGTGTVTLSNANTYTGITTLNGGTLVLSGGNNRLLPTSTLKLGGGTLALDASHQAVTNVIVNADGGSVTGTGTFTNSGTPAATGNYLMNGSATIGAPLAGNLYVSGDGVSKLTFSGGLSSTANRIVVGAGGKAVQDGGDVTVANFMMVGRNDGSAGPALGGTGNYTLNSGTLSVASGLYLGWNASTNYGAFTQNGGTNQVAGQGVHLGIGGGHGTYNLNGGVLVSILNNSSPGTQDFNFGGGTLRTSAGHHAWSGLTTTIADGKTAYIDTQSYSVFWDGPIFGTSDAGLVKSGSGQLTLYGTNTYAGPTVVSNGNFVISGSAVLGGGAYAGAITNSGAFYYWSSADQVFSGRISGTGSLTKSTGGGVLTLGGDSTYSGATSVGNGTLRLGSNTALGSSAATVTGVGGGTLDLNGMTIANAVTTGFGATGVGNAGCLQNSDTAIAAALNGPVALGGHNYVGGAGNVTVGGPVTGGVSDGTYAILKTGAGTWTLACPTNTYNGYTHIAEGTLAVTKMANLNEMSSLGQPTSAAANSVVFWVSGSGGTLMYVGNSASTSSRALAIDNATLNAVNASGTAPSATLALNGGTTGTRALTLTGTNTGTNTFGGAIGCASLTKSGTGQWVVDAINTYAGGTVVQNGTLTVGVTGTLGTTNVTVSAGAHLTMRNGAAIADTARLSIADGATCQLDAGVNETVNELALGSVLMWPGTWGSDECTTCQNHDSRFSGPGMLTVKTGSRHPATTFMFR